MSYKSKVIQKELDRAAERKDNRSGFTSRNYWLSVILVFIVLPIGTAISVFTEGFNYYETWASGFSDTYRMAAVASVAIVVNSLIIMLGKGVVDDIQDGVFSGKMYDKITFVVKSVAFMAVLGWSVAQSLEGAPLFRVQMAEDRAPVADLLTDPATINAEYADRRAQQLSIIAAAKATTWKGNMTRDAVRSMRSAQAALNNIDAEITAGRQAVTASNAEVTTKYNDDLARDAGSATSIAGLGQLVQLFGILFLGLWHTGVEDEAGFEGATAGAKRGSTASSRPIGFGHSAAAAHHPTSHGDSPDPTAMKTRRRAGFKQYDTEATPPYPAPKASAAPAAAQTVPSAAPTADSIATHRDNDAARKYESASPDHLFGSWKRKNSNKQSYANPNRTQTESTSAAILRYNEELEAIEKELALRGLKIELQESPRRRYVLLPI